VNRKAVLPADLQRGLPYGEAVGQLLTVDWDTVNANRTAWNNRWTREIER
jgi:putative spermidine/putrescine transport system substrate-binding protein